MNRPDSVEYVYLVTASGEWPVSAIADDHVSTPDRVEREVLRRAESANVGTRDRVHVWRLKVRPEDLEEVDVMPATVVRPSIRPRA